MARAQFSEYSQPPLVYEFPDTHHPTSKRLDAAHFDHDQVLDALYLSHGTLSIVYGPAIYPYVQDLAGGIADYAVLPPELHGTVTCSDVLAVGAAAGVLQIVWDSVPDPVGSAVVGTVAADAAWSTAHGLRCAPDAGTTRVLGIAASGQDLLVGDFNGASLTKTTLPVGSAILHAELLEFDGDPDLEIAYTTAAGLFLLDESGTPLAAPVSPLNGVIALQVNPDGGTLGDTLLYCVAYPGVEHYVYEVGWDGSGTTLSNPLMSGFDLVSDLAVAQIGSSPLPDLVATFSNSSNLIVLRQLPPPDPPVSWVDSFTFPTTPDFWRIDLSNPVYGTPVIDPGLACGDFDNDGIDDLLLLDMGQEVPRLLLHTGSNAVTVGPVPYGPVQPPPGSPPDTETAWMSISADLEMPSGWTELPTHLKWEVWERAGMNLIPRATIASGEESTAGMLPDDPIPVDEWITVSNAPSNTAVYVRLTWLRKVNGTVVQTSLSTAWLGWICDVPWPAACILCQESDQYTPPDPCAGDPCGQFATCNPPDDTPLVKGYNRRWRVGPFAQ